MKLREIGGFYYTQKLAMLGNTVNFPIRKVLYLSARSAIGKLVEMLGASNLWLPTQFCPHTITFLRARVNVRLYEDDFTRAEPVLGDIEPSPGDVVLLMNYFGCRAMVDVANQHNLAKCYILEDHTHSPVSYRAMTSEAHYCIASLRKVLPVPDGGLLWSPRCLSLPALQAGLSIDRRVELLSDAMNKKAVFIGGGEKDHSLKRQFRDEYQLAEMVFDDIHSSLKPSRYATRMVTQGYPVRWLLQRTSNAITLRNALQGHFQTEISHCTVVKDMAPLGLPLLFHDDKTRDAYRNWLASNDVYCPVHWATDGNKDLSPVGDRELTLPIDHRYTNQDMMRIAHLMITFRLEGGEA